MPPKARGSTRGSRARGGSTRGGATSNTTRATATPLEQETATEAVVARAADVIVPKAEAEEDGELNVEPVESQIPASAATSSISSPQTIADSPASARPPVQRLDSLKSAAPSSRSASPAAARRGGTTRGGKKLAVKPTFTGRRSKEERDARDKLDRERQKEREREAAAKAQKNAKDAKRAEERAQRGGANKRGGYSGPVTGPFSLGSSTQDRKTNNRSNPYGASGTGSGSRAVHIKREYNGEPGEGSESHRSSGGTSGIKSEDDGYVVSSDDEENPEFPRKDIETIELSSGEEDATGPPIHKERTNMPVRVGRKQHHDRVVGINTEASADAPAKGQQSEVTDTSPTDTIDGPSRKGKGKAKDLEITGVRKPYKGMWQDADEPQIQVKPEPVSDDDEGQGPAEEVGIYEASNRAAEKQPMSPELEKKAKARKQAGTEPVMQTDEDRQEWARFQSNLRHIRAELGPGAEDVDVGGDVVMGDAADTTGKLKMSVRDNNVYLFQIPPIMPDLLPPHVKSETSDEPLIPHPTTQQTPIKIEEGTVAPTTKATISSGYVGKLRVHQSGRTTLDWGGTSYELNPGHKASYLQEVVSLNIVPEQDRLVEEDGGEATSYGRVKGKFVVVPAWEKMLG